MTNSELQTTMKRTIQYLTAIIVLCACAQSPKPDDPDYRQLQARLAAIETNQDAKPLSLNSLLTLSDAEKILGEPAHLDDSSNQYKEDALVYQCSYKANSEDAKSKRTGSLYFLVEQYKEVASAQKKYSFIKTANENHGIKVLHHLGDEAYFHSDGENFYFVMVRKGKKVFNMKVNKITSTTSLEAFNAIAEKITRAL